MLQTRKGLIIAPISPANSWGVYMGVSGWGGVWYVVYACVRNGRVYIRFSRSAGGWDARMSPHWGLF